MIDIDDDSDDSPGESGQVVFMQRESDPGGKKSKKPDGDTPIDNALDIPLFQDADKRGFKTALYISVYKQDEPNSGYKGNVPLTTTYETIGKLFGNGLYTIKACNHRHQELRSKENIKIDLQTSRTPAIEDNVEKDDKSIMSIDIIREILAKEDKNTERLLALATAGSTEAVKQNREYTLLVQTTMEKAAERDREFTKAQNKNQQDFFTGIMLAQNQMFQQTMAMLSAGHAMTIQVLKTERETTKDPVEQLLKGLALGRELAGTDDGSPDWLKALHSGENMLTKLLMLKKENDKPGTETESNPVTKTNSNLKPGPKTKIPLTRGEVVEIVRLKEVLDKEGIDLTSLVKQARESYIKAEVVEDSKEESSDDENESAEQNSQEGSPEAS